MGWHVTVVFSPLAAGEVTVQGQLAVPVRGGVGPALRPAPRPGAAADLVDALAGPATARAATAAPAAMMIVRLHKRIFTDSRLARLAAGQTSRRRWRPPSHRPARWAAPGPG